MKRMQNQAKSVSKRTWREKMTYMKKNWQLYLFFLMPGLLLTIIFKYLPMGGLLIAFEDYNVIKGVLGSPWVGLEYFRRFLSSPDFMNYLMNTLKLSIYGLQWGFPVPIILALLLNRIRKTGIKKKVQLLIYMPNFISVIVLCGMVRMLLSPVGPLNKVLGISTNWMTMPSAFRTIYIASGIWQAAGWSSIMYTAALANASKELEEAATMDGANLLQQIWYVELPAIKNIIVIQFILQAGNIMSIGFEKAYALQTDMNLPASEILSTYVYRIGLLNGDYGYSTAVGLFNSVVNVILLIFVNCVVKKLNDGEGLQKRGRRDGEKKKKKYSRTDKVILGIGFTILGLFVLSIAIPIIYVVLASFMDPTVLNNQGLSFNIKDWTLDAYRRVLENEMIWRGFLNSFLYSLAFTVISVFVTLLAAYPLSKKEFVGRKVFNIIFLITMFFGGGMIPTFILINQLHMVNTVWAILIPGAFNVWNMILARTYYQSIPTELREASAIDGANEIQHFFKIMIPVCKPIIAVLALWSFVGMWNSYFDAMIYLNDANLQPLQLVLRSILVQNTPQPGMIADIQSTAEMAKIAEQLKYATIVVSSLPLLVMYPFFQKYFDKGIMVGSVKG